MQQARLTVHCAQPCFVPGDIVAGFVRVQVTSPVEVVRVGLKVSVQLLAQAKGVVRPAQQPGQPQQAASLQTRGKTKTLHEREIDLMKNVGILEEGEYEFGFKFVLPPDLPSTIDHQVNDCILRVSGLLIPVLVTTGAPPLLAPHAFNIVQNWWDADFARNRLTPNYVDFTTQCVVAQIPSIPARARIQADTNVLSTVSDGMQFAIELNMETKQSPTLVVELEEIVHTEVAGVAQTERTVSTIFSTATPPFFYGVYFVHVKPPRLPTMILDTDFAIYCVRIRLGAAVLATLAVPSTINFGDLPTTMSAVTRAQSHADVVLYRKIWHHDTSTVQCTTCAKPFSLVARRHHCRACMRIFCKQCSEFQAPLPHLGYSRPFRVCRECFQQPESQQLLRDPSQELQANIVMGLSRALLVRPRAQRALEYTQFVHPSVAAASASAQSSNVNTNNVNPVFNITIGGAAGASATPVATAVPSAPDAKLV